MSSVLAVKLDLCTAFNACLCKDTFSIYKYVVSNLCMAQKLDS